MKDRPFKPRFSVLANPHFPCFLRPPFTKRAVAQSGSALAWGARGRGFESRQPDSKKLPSRELFSIRQPRRKSSRESTGLKAVNASPIYSEVYILNVCEGLRGLSRSHPAERDACDGGDSHISSSVRPEASGAKSS